MTPKTGFDCGSLALGALRRERANGQFGESEVSQALDERWRQRRTRPHQDDPAGVGHGTLEHLSDLDLIDANGWHSDAHGSCAPPGSAERRCGFNGRRHFRADGGDGSRLC